MDALSMDGLRDGLLGGWMDGGLIHELGTHMDTLIGIFMDRLMD
jgi:hypothetical protein